MEYYARERTCTLRRGKRTRYGAARAARRDPRMPWRAGCKAGGARARSCGCATSGASAASATVTCLLVCKQAIFCPAKQSSPGACQELRLRDERRERGQRDRLPARVRPLRLQRPQQEQRVEGAHLRLGRRAQARLRAPRHPRLGPLPAMHDPPLNCRAHCHAD